MRRNCIVIIFLPVLIFISHYNSNGQARSIDSLKRMLELNDGYWKSGLGRTVLKINIAGEYQLLKEYDKSNEYLNDANRIDDSMLHESLNNPANANELKYALHYKVNILNQYGFYNLYSLGKYDTALSYFQKALVICKYPTEAGSYGGVYSNIARVFTYEGDFGKALICFQQALDSLKKAPDVPNNNSKIFAIAGAYINMGLIKKQQGDYKQALDYFNLALPIYKEVNRTEHRRAEDIAATFTKLGSVYLALSDYPEALKNYFEAFHLYNSANFKSGIAGSYLNMGDVYKNQGNNDDALDNYKKALEIYLQLESKEDIALCYSSIGDVLKTEKKYIQSLGYLTKVLATANQTGNKPQIATTLYTIGNLYYSVAVNLAGSTHAKIKDSLLTQSVSYCNQALAIDRKINANPEIGASLITAANAQTELGQYDEALKNCEEGLAIARNIHLKDEIKDGYQAMEKISEKKGELEKALNYYSLWALYKDSILNESTNKQLTDLWVSFETEQKNNEIDLLNTEKAINDLTIENQNAKIAEQQFDELKRQNEIKLLNQDKEIQALTLNQKESELKEQKLQAQASAGKIKLLNKEKEVEAAELRRQSFIRNVSIAFALLILLFAGVMVNRFFVIREQKKIITEEKKISERLLQSQLTELEASAKRAQMNPHFVFNSLNSIQNYIWNSNPKEATEYLARFAKLIRLVLENSRKDLVPLEKDLSDLEYYIQLETLRFSNKFQYNILCDPEIDKSEVMVPPLIIQPFVENAILHGLFHKKENGWLTINIKKKDADKLQVIIEDNGVGRIRAKEISYDKSKNHKSFGMQVTRERLENLSNWKVGESAVSVTDLLDELKQPCGTKVEIELPLF